MADGKQNVNEILRKGSLDVFGFTVVLVVVMLPL